MSEVLLLGDSHLARIRGNRVRFLQEATGHSVRNAAVGGADVRDVIGQVPAEVDAPVVVVSVGTNDAAPWKQVPLATYAEALDRSLVRLAGRTVVYLGPPGVDEARLDGSRDRTNASIRQYAAVGGQAVRRHGGVAVEVADRLARLSTDVFEDDGVHLNDCGYDVLLEALADAIRVAAARR